MADSAAERSPSADSGPTRDDGADSALGSASGKLSRRSRLVRRRRENAPAGTKKKREVWVTAEEEAQLVIRAEREGVTVPRLLVSAATSETVETPTERRAVIAELMALHRLLASVSNNVNQIARHANAGDEFPKEAKAALVYVRRVAERVDATIDGINT